MPRKKQPEITLDQLEALARQHDRVLMKQGKLIGYVYAAQYENGAGETILHIKEAGTVKALAKRILKDLGINPVQVDAITEGQ